MSCKMYTIAENSKVLMLNIRTSGSMQDESEAAQKISLCDYFTHCDHTCKTTRPHKRADFETKAGDLCVRPLKNVTLR